MNDTLKTIDSLRTIHGDFSDREVNTGDLNLILQASVRTANASARQSYSIIVIEDREQMRDLFGYQGSRALIYCVDFTRLNAGAGYLGCEFSNDDIIGFITGSIDTILAAQTAVLAAKSLGIDSLVTNGLHRKELDQVYAMLHLPQTSCFPLITLVLGYPKSEPSYQKGRLSLDQVVHYGRYQTSSPEKLEAMVKEYDDHDRHIGLVNNWEEMGFQHYLDWFYTKWSGKPPARQVAEGKVLEFQQRIRKSGFWWPEE